ncbi:MAG: DUF3048 domain-containing protein [Wujia sp.]
MKKSKVLSLALVAALTATSMVGCGKKEKTTEATTTEQAVIDVNEVATMSDAEDIQLVQKEGYVINEYSGEWIDEKLKDQRPLCIMINNLSDAMPQSGISQADVIFEMMVEGGITRLLALFKDYSNIPKLGPVRSARHYYVKVANSIDAIYAHVGWSVFAEAEINNTGCNNLNGLYDTITYYRDESRVAPHNCYTNSEKIAEGIENMGYRTTYADTSANRPNMFAFNYEDKDLEGGKPANKINTYLSSYTSPWFEYDSSKKVYNRYQYKDKQIDDQTAEQLTFKNVLVIQADYWDVVEGLQELDWERGGPGIYATNGQYIDITWRKKDGVINFFTEDGEQLKMNPGKTFITVADDEKAEITVE